MTEQHITPFLFESDHLVRVIDRDGEPWFVVVDICRIIGHSQPSRAVENLDPDEKGVSSTHTPGGQQDLLTVSESGLFTLILRSRQAMTPGTVQHRFRKWVTAEVLPAIRKTGRYELPKVDVAPVEVPDREVSEGHKLRLVSETRQSFGTRASCELWFTLGLPRVPAMYAALAQGDLFGGIPGGVSNGSAH